jgi:crotonobetainyl-CoA:carnitine CoA-transferase CaiB-like acyl-CoA transferase
MPGEATSRPLDGIRVVDLTQFYAGPLATSWLGDMGADVVKVERPRTGDPTRPVDDLLGGGFSSYFAGLNRSKRSIELDLSTSEGAEALRNLARAADVLVENFRPGVMDRLNLGYETLRRENARLIYCAISSFGPEGPLAQKPGMDIIVQAMGGVMGLTGAVGGPAMRVGAPVADYVGSLQSTVGITTALYERERSGRGQFVDISLLDGQMAMLSNYIVGFRFTGRPRGPLGNYHPQLVPYQPYDTQDGSVVVACLTEEFWRRMCHLLGLEELVVNPSFITNSTRVQHRDELNAVLEPVFAGMKSGELISKLEGADVPCAEIMSLAELLDSPQVVFRNSLISIDHPSIPSYQVVATPFRFSRTPAHPSRPAPGLGQHTEEVLLEVGMAVDEIRVLNRDR